MDELNILRISPSTYPEVVGGVGLHVHHLSEKQAEMGHNVTVLTSDNGDHDLPRYEWRNGYQLVRHRELARPLNNSIVPTILWSLNERIEDTDVLHIHSHLYFSSLVGSLLARRADDLPVVATNHGMISQSAPTWLQRAYRPISRYVYETADRIFCYTETDVNRLRNWDITTQASIISNGIDVSRFTPDATTVWTDRFDDDPYLLFVGRLHPGKGVEHLINAFATIEKELPHNLVIIGDGPDRDTLENQVTEHGLENRVTFLGEVENNTLPGLYANADVFVLPSLSEGMPRTVLEALACGTPVVANELPQLKPVLEGTGMMAPSTHPSEFGDAIVRVATSDERESMEKQARKRIEAEFTWSETVERVTEVYHELTNGV